MTFRVLVIEDDEKIGASLLEVLEREGYGAVWARTGEDGFFCWSTESFDLVILDLGLPGRGGLEILCARRKVTSLASACCWLAECGRMRSQNALACRYRFMPQNTTTW